MTSEQLDILRECCRDDAAFERLKQVLSANKVDDGQGSSDFRWVGQDITRFCGVAEDVTEHKQAEEALRQQTEQARLLGVMRDRICRSLNLEEILNTTVAEVRQFLACDRVLVYRFQPDWDGVVVVESVGPEWTPLLANYIRDDWFAENCVKQYQQGRVFVIEDVCTAGLTQCHFDVMAQLRVKANLVVPIIQNGDRLWGLLIAHHCAAPRQWQPAEIDLLKQLATQVAIAIQQAQLYQQLSATNTDLERQVQERTVELQQKIQELQELNDLKDDFLSTVSHELRTPLTNMKMAIQLIKIASSPERQQRYMEILQAECNREAELINDLLDLQRLEATSYNLLLSGETISILDWIPSIIEPFRSRLLERHQTLQLNLPPDLPSLVSDPNGLGRILTELLNNACKYTGAGGEISLSVNHQSRIFKGTSDVQPVIIFAVSNQAEIPTAALSRIFEKFYRVPHADPWKQGGTGLGLALVQKLVTQLGGTIEVESDGGWTTFTVRLPS